MSHPDRPPTPAPDDELGERLRRALNAEAGPTTPRGDGLALIRERVATRPGLARWWQPVAGLAAAAAVVAIAVSVGSPRDSMTVAEPAANERTSDPIGEPPDGSPSADPSTGAGGPQAGSQTGPGIGTGAQVTVPVYYLHDDTTGVGLYREYHRVPELAGGRAPTAVQQMLSAPALDPDYTSLWAPGTRVLSYQREGAIARLDLSADALADAPAGSAAAAASVQQLVYTVTAAEQDSSLRVALTVEGESVGQLWGSVEANQPVGRAPSLDVLGQAWLLGPAQGATVRSPVELTVYGTAYEGHTVLRVFRTGGSAPTSEPDSEPVTETFVTTAMGEFRTASATADLPPGRYVVRAYTEHGEEMTLLERDSKEFTVE